MESYQKFPMRYHYSCSSGKFLYCNAFFGHGAIAPEFHTYKWVGIRLTANVVIWLRFAHARKSA